MDFESRMSEGKPFRWGILSTGGIAQHFARDLHRLPDHKIVAGESIRIGSNGALG
jgi:predicted dehydrogenase